MLNAYWEPLTFELPPLPARGLRWRRCIDTARSSPHDISRLEEAQDIASTVCVVEPRSIVLAALALPKPERSAPWLPALAGRTRACRREWQKLEDVESGMLRTAIGKAWPAVLACCAFALAGSGVAGWRAQSLTGTAASGGDAVRVLSWNVSSDAFVRDPASFRALLTSADADILLFDEVGPDTTEAQLRAALARRRDGGGDWHVDIGRSGGRQRGVIVSRVALERLPEMSEVVPYPARERERHPEPHGRREGGPPRLQHGWRRAGQRRHPARGIAPPAGRHRRPAVLRRRSRGVGGGAPAGRGAGDPTRGSSRC